MSSQTPSKKKKIQEEVKIQNPANSNLDIISISSTVTIDNASQKIKCDIHKREKIMFYCKDDKKKLCGICVPQHSGHEIINIKECCSKLAKPWIDLKTQTTRQRSRIDQDPEIRAKIPDSKYETIVDRCEKFFNIKYKEIMQLKDALDFEALELQEMQFVRYKEKLKDFLAKIFATYVDNKSPDNPKASSKKRPKPLPLEVVKPETEEVNAQMSKLHSTISALELRVHKVEGILTTLNQRNKKLKDEFSQLYDYVTKYPDDQSKYEQTIGAIDIQSIMTSSKKKRENKEISKLVEKSKKHRSKSESRNSLDEGHTEHQQKLSSSLDFGINQHKKTLTFAKSMKDNNEDDGPLSQLSHP